MSGKANEVMLHARSLGANLRGFDRGWQTCFVDVCFSVSDEAHLPRGPAGSMLLMDSLLNDPGKDVLEAVYRLGGEPAMFKIVGRRVCDLLEKGLR